MGVYTCGSCAFSGTLLQVVQHTYNGKRPHGAGACCCICKNVVTRRPRLHIRRCHPNDCTVRCTACSEPFVAEIDMRNHRENGCKKTGRGSPVMKKPIASAFSSLSLHSPSTIPAGFDSFLNTCRPDDIDKYISQHLQPDKTFSAECRDVVDRVGMLFRDSKAITVNRFIKGGSVGKGTAIKSKSDVDCVLFTSDLPSIGSRDYKSQLRRYLELAEDLLKESSIAYHMQVLDRTSHAVKLRMKTRKEGHESLDMDLLLTTDLLGVNPTHDKKEKVYSMMDRMSASARENCSAALVELQRDFVKQQSDDVKDLIRLVKMWKNTYVAETGLTSYQLELLCIHVRPYHYSVKSAFKAVLEKLRDYESICIYWTDNYPYNRAADMLHKRPLILDPANPFNNVADRCRDWPAVSQAARETLQKPFFMYL